MNYRPAHQIVLLFLALVYFTACAPVSSEVQRSATDAPVLRSVGPDKDDSELPVIKAIKGFWKSAESGNEDELNKYVSESPDGFFINSVAAVEHPDSAAPVVNQAQAGQGLGTSVGDRAATLSLLKHFASQIRESKLELLKARVVRSNNDEAVVKIDWVDAINKEKGGSLSQHLLLYRRHDGWKVFMLTDSITLEKSNKEFGHPH